MDQETIDMEETLYDETQNTLETYYIDHGSEDLLHGDGSYKHLNISDINQGDKNQGEEEGRNEDSSISADGNKIGGEHMSITDDDDDDDDDSKFMSVDELAREEAAKKFANENQIEETISEDSGVESVQNEQNEDVSMESKNSSKVKEKSEKKHIFSCDPNMSEAEFQSIVLDASNFDVYQKWKPEWKKQMRGMTNPRSGHTNRNLTRQHKKVVCSMAFPSVKVTLTANYLVIQGTASLVHKVKRGLISQNILTEPWSVSTKPDHIHLVLPKMDLTNIDVLTNSQAAHYLVDLIRANNDVVCNYSIT